MSAKELEKEEVEEVTEVVEEAVEAEEDYDAKASEMGWVPKDQWRGDPKQWRPAEEFVKRGENIIPILNDRLQKLESDLKIAAKVNKQELEAVKKESYERAKDEYEAKMADIAAAENKAFTEGDQETWEAIKAKRDTIKPPQEPKLDEPEEQVSPEFEPWLKKNPWYTNDSELHVYADTIGEGIANVNKTQGKSSTDAEFYQQVESAVKAAFPQKFTNSRREAAPEVESATEAPRKGGKKTFNDIPANAKAQYDRMKKNFELQGRKFSKEQYAEAYFEE